MKKLALLIYIMCGVVAGHCCTSAIISAARSATGRPLLWKHRDTGADNNFVARVAPTDSTLGYVALFNGGDSLLVEAWTGMNDAGFAIMNTASYNLAPDTARIKDCEGLVMTAALRSCRTVDDFEHLLQTLPKPLGVQANFGIIDAAGGAAYFETDDYSWTRFDVADSPSGYLIRTNFSVTGDSGQGYGYIRYNTASQLIEENVDRLVPLAFTDGFSRSFRHSLTGHDYLAEGARYVVDSDFIPRDISTASIVIEGVNSPADSADMVMWTALGYPPCAQTVAITASSIPSDCGPDLPGYRSSACERAMVLRRTLRPYSGGSGYKYIDLNKLRLILTRTRQNF